MKQMYVFQTLILYIFAWSGLVQAQLPSDTIRARMWDSLAVIRLDFRRAAAARPYLDSLRWVRTEFPGRDSIPFADWQYGEARYHFFTGSPISGLAFIQNTIRLREKSGRYPPISHPMGLALNLRGLLQNQAEHHILALESHRQAMAIREEIARRQGTFDYKNMPAYCYANMGRTLSSLGQYDQGIDYIQLALPDIRDSAKAHRELEPYVPILCANLGGCYLGTRDHELAEKYFQQALSMYGLSFTEQAVVWANRGINQAYLGNYVMADSFFRQAQQLGIGTSSYPAAAMRQSQGALLLEQGNFPAGEDSLRQALRIFRAHFGTESPIVSGACYNIGICFYLQNRPDSAFYYAQIAGVALGNEPAGRFFPDFAKSKGLAARALIQRYRNEGRKDRSLLEKVVAEVQAVEDSFDLSVTSLEGELQFFNMASGLKYVIEPAIIALYYLYESDSDDSHIARAFRLSEKTRASLWLEKYRLRNESLDADPVSQQRLAFRKQLANLQTQHIIAESLMDSNAVRIVDRKTVDLRRRHSAYLAELERRNPSMSAHRYGVGTIPADSVQRLLAPDEVLLSYFVSDSSVFIFSLTRESLHMNIQERTFIRPSVERLTDALGRDFENIRFPRLSSKSVTTYFGEAEFLYSKLIAPVKHALTEGKRLIIIPDETIGHLAFEALCESSQTARFPDMDYLIFHHSIRYGYSATALFETSKKDQPGTYTARFLGVAPVFPKTTDDAAEKRHYGLQRKVLLTPLRYNADETRLVYDIITKGDGMPSEKWIGPEAVKNRFLEYAKNFQIILLSTHGWVDEQINEHSFIAFSNVDAEGPTSRYLFMPEVESMALNCELIVLSACKTALGRLRKGEGVISLARTFSLAGAQSVLNTLWSTEDETSMLLMKYFFNNLKEGQSKDRALQNAKVSYLKNPKMEVTKKFPYFWAQFALTGSDAPLRR